MCTTSLLFPIAFLFSFSFFNRANYAHRGVKWCMLSPGALRQLSRQTLQWTGPPLCARGRPRMRRCEKMCACVCVCVCVCVCKFLSCCFVCPFSIITITHTLLSSRSPLLNAAACLNCPPTLPLPLPPSYLIRQVRNSFFFFFFDKSANTLHPAAHVCHRSLEIFFSKLQTQPPYRVPR